MVRKNLEVLELPTDFDVILSLDWHISMLRGTEDHGSAATPGLQLSSIFEMASVGTIQSSLPLLPKYS